MNSDDVEGKVQRSLEAYAVDLIGKEFTPKIKVMSTKVGLLTYSATQSITLESYEKEQKFTFRKWKEEIPEGQVKQNDKDELKKLIDSGQCKPANDALRAVVSLTKPEDTLGTGSKSVLIGDYKGQCVCHSCDGEKSAECGTCKGAGITECHVCKGYNGKICPSCMGRKTKPLAVGNGETNCTTCSGLGRVKCFRCKGGYVECGHCEHGKIACRTCDEVGKLVQRVLVYGNISWTRSVSAVSGADSFLPSDVQSIVKEYTPGDAASTSKHTKPVDIFESKNRYVLKSEFVMPAYESQVKVSGETCTTRQYGESIRTFSLGGFLSSTFEKLADKVSNLSTIEGLKSYFDIPIVSKIAKHEYENSDANNRSQKIHNAYSVESIRTLKRSITNSSIILKKLKRPKISSCVYHGFLSFLIPIAIFLGANSIAGLDNVLDKFNYFSVDVNTKTIEYTVPYIAMAFEDPGILSDALSPFVDENNYSGHNWILFPLLFAFLTLIFGVPFLFAPGKLSFGRFVLAMPATAMILLVQTLMFDINDDRLRDVIDLPLLKMPNEFLMWLQTAIIGFSTVAFELLLIFGFIGYLRARKKRHLSVAKEIEEKGTETIAIMLDLPFKKAEQVKKGSGVKE